MPRYQYQCNCGVLFEATASMKDHSQTKPCPDCGEQSSRKMPTDINSTFNQSMEGIGPQNTGVSQLDAHIDRVIGQSAQQSWSEIEKRERVKKEILAKNPNIPVSQLSRNPDGSYRILKPEEKAVQERALKIDALAVENQKNNPPPN